MIIGVDKGSALTKTAAGIKIRSTVRKMNNEIDIKGLDSSGIKISINNVKYMFGEEGDYATDLLKSEQESTKLLTYAAIIQSGVKSGEDVYLLVGLPIGQYTKQRTAMRQLLYSQEPIYYTKPNDEHGHFFIKDVDVFPECAAAFYSQNTDKYTDKSVLLLDIGGLSVDAIHFIDRKVIKYDTVELGVMNLFARMASEINNTFNTKHSQWDMDRILTHGLRIRGEKQDTAFLQKDLSDHVINIYNWLKMQFDLNSIDEVIMLGGGGELFFNELKKYVPQATLKENALLANAEGLQIIAEERFNESNKNN